MTFDQRAWEPRTPQEGLPVPAAHSASIPGFYRDSALEHRALVITSAAMAASRGVPPRPHLKNYVSDRIFDRLTQRSRVHPAQRPDPGYQSRCYLSAVNSQAVEASVVVFGDHQVRAVAVRLERLGRTWRAVEVRVL
jgi:hypothetical protein